MKKLFTIFLLVLAAYNIKAQDEMHVFDSLRNDALSASSDSAKVSCLMILVDYYSENFGDLDTVLKYSDMGIALAKQYNDTADEAYFYRLLGWEYSYFEMPEAAEYFFKALNMYEDSGDSPQQIQLLCDIGGYFSNLNNNNLGFEYCQKALNLSKRSKCSDYDYIIYSYMGILNYNIGLFGIAKEYFEKSKECASSSDNMDNVLEQNLNIAQSEFNTDSCKYEAVLREEAAYKAYADKKGDICDYILTLFDHIIRAYKSDNTSKAQRESLMRKMRIWLPSMHADIMVYNSALMYATLLKYYILIDSRNMADRMAAEVLSAINNPESTPDISCYNTLKEYYLYIHDWKRASEYVDKYRHIMAVYSNAEFSAQNEAAPAEMEYRAKVHKADLESQERDMRYAQEMRYNSAARNWMYGVGAFILAFILMMARNHRVQSEQMSLLNCQTEEIMTANEELNTQHEEIIVQRDEIIYQANHLKSQRDIMARYNRNLMQSIVYAEQIQRAIVPSERSLRSMFSESFVLWNPRDIVSGDFYWLFSTKNRKYAVVADCTGHGVPGALVSMLGISILNDISYQMDSLNAGQILDLMRSRVSNSLSRSYDEVDDGMDMALYIMSKEESVESKEESVESKEESAESKDADEGIKNQKLKIKNDLQFAGAKRPLVMVRDGEITVLKPDKKSICVDRYGIETGDFKTHEMELQSGDMVYIFSDGLPDQIGGPTGFKKFGSKQFYQLLLSAASQPVDSQPDIINNAVKDWSRTCYLGDESETQVDDQLIIGVRVV